MSKLVESSETLTRNSDNTWEVVLITPGKGSSGIYTEEMLRAYGPKAFPAGTHSYAGHEKQTGPRIPQNQIGVLAEDAYYEDGVGLKGKLKVFKHWANFVEEVAPYTGLSIAVSSFNGTDTPEGFLVEELLPDRFNTIDLVSYAGRGGAIVEKLFESAMEMAAEKEEKTSLVEGSRSAVAASGKQGKENLLEIEELAKKVDGLTESLATLTELVSPLVESLRAPEVTDEVDVAAAVESAIDKAEEAGVPRELRGSILEAAKTGGDVDAAIASQVSIVEAVKSKVLSESAGRFGGASDNFNPIIPRWAGK